MSAIPKPRTVKDAAWLRHLRTLPCHFARFRDCSDPLGTGIEVSHLQGKSLDSAALPSCPGHHRMNRIAWHNGARSFCLHYALWKDDLIHEAEAQYAAYRNALENR